MFLEGEGTVLSEVKENKDVVKAIGLSIEG